MAVDAFRTMWGGSQSKLMLGADERLWVVKFQNNPQHLRVLANELIATRIAKAIGLTVPETDVIDVPAWLAMNHPSLEIELVGGRRERCLPGLQFGSAFVGGLMPGLVVDRLRDEDLRNVRNIGEFAGILAFDKWMGNCDGRQAVFSRTPGERKYRAVFIDQGRCFNTAEWDFPDRTLWGMYSRNSVYAGVTGWTSFEPWLSRIEAMKMTTLSQIVEAVPPLWYGSNTALIQNLCADLLARKCLVRDLIVAFRDSEGQPFPRWIF